MKAKFTLLVLVIAMTVFSCQESEAPLEPGETVSLSRISGNEAYASLPLVGTRWQLLGFADEKDGEIRLAEPYSDDSYTLVFGGSGTITGVTSTNSAHGEYSVNNSQLSILSFGSMTYINELFDGPLYIENMNQVSGSKMTSKGLHLFYEGSKFLLFQPVQ